MADHRAEQIIAAVVTKATGLTTTGTRVFRGRVYPLQETDLPALTVYLGSDKPNEETSSYSFIDSNLTISIDAHVKSTAQVDTTLNEIRKQVTFALQADITQGLAFVIDTVEGDASEPELTGEGDKPIARMRMDWTIRYRRSRKDASA